MKDLQEVLQTPRSARSRRHSELFPRVKCGNSIYQFLEARPDGVPVDALSVGTSMSCSFLGHVLSHVRDNRDRMGCGWG